MSNTSSGSGAEPTYVLEESTSGHDDDVNAEYCDPFAEFGSPIYDDPFNDGDGDNDEGAIGDGLGVAAVQQQQNPFAASMRGMLGKMKGENRPAVSKEAKTGPPVLQNLRQRWMDHRDRASTDRLARGDGSRLDPPPKEQKLPPSASSLVAQTAKNVQSQQHKKGTLSDKNNNNPNEVDIASLRPGRISISVERPSRDTKLGIGIREQVVRRRKTDPTSHDAPAFQIVHDGEQSQSQQSRVSDGGEELMKSKDEDTKAGKEENMEDDSKVPIDHSPPEKLPSRIVIAATAIEDPTCLLHNCPLQVGDILVSINEQPCANAGYEETAEKLKNVVGPVSIKLSTPNGNKNIVQALVTKPQQDSMIGVGFTAMQHVHDGKMTKILCINHISPHGLLAHSVLAQGDLVLAINSTACSYKTPDEAAEFVRNEPKHVSIVAIRPTGESINGKGSGESNFTERLRQNARRAAIGVGGGALVGVGLVFIPTLPPPFGEVLIVGGVSLLGTEFEAPKNFVRKARDSLAKVVEDDKEAPIEPDSDKDPTLKEDDADGSSGNAKGADKSLDNDDEEPAKRPTVKDRFKKFGRNVVLPFLDQVTGDHKAEAEPKNEGTCNSEEETAPADESASGNNVSIPTSMPPVEEEILDPSPSVSQSSDVPVTSASDSLESDKNGSKNDGSLQK